MMIIVMFEQYHRILRVGCGEDPCGGIRRLSWPASTRLTIILSRQHVVVIIIAIIIVVIINIIMKIDS